MPPAIKTAGREVSSCSANAPCGTSSSISIKTLSPASMWLRIRLDAESRIRMAITKSGSAGVLTSEKTILTWWLDRGAKSPPAVVDQMFRRLATDGILAPVLKAADPARAAPGVMCGTHPCAAGAVPLLP